ncbi:hypothetical protein Q9L42_003490 [Methylomarinum sp. Ch1-1]|uniref:Uncharacterized protein n=1 Tax=Methylomarinum roseum TaxID=3067653 RepID=A0AAU7NVZ8_9GAMM|nr:hypothetical protein [Methylomarinum sp. Ch1-1]MDP4522751.1 hypothetical protein [Methylomarinum sp. Ch1-1]
MPKIDSKHQTMTPNKQSMHRHILEQAGCNPGLNLSTLSQTKNQNVRGGLNNPPRAEIEENEAGSQDEAQADAEDQQQAPNNDPQ